MNEEPKDIINEELIYRHFHGDVSTEEKKIVEEWAELSMKNQSKFDKMHLFYLDTKAISSIDQNKHSYDTKKAWQAFTKKNIPAKGLEIHIPYQTLRIAAAIMIMLGGAWLYLSSHTLQIVIAKEEILPITLVDGSDILLSKGSELSYPNLFSDDKRVVELKGKAFFDIQKKPESPFIIQLGKAKVQVLGTSFNIDATNEDSIVVSVETGRVWFKSNTDAKILTNGQTGIFSINQSTISSINSPSTGEQNFWRTKTLNFQGKTLHDVITVLRQTYDADIILSNQAISQCKISVKFKNESIENIMDVIGATLKLEVKSNKNQYILEGNACNL